MKIEIVAIKNFYRNRMVNLTAASVRHFLPKAIIHSFNFLDEKRLSYPGKDYLHQDIVQHYFSTKYVNKNNSTYDHVDSTKTSGYENSENVKYFSEGINVIVDHFRYHNENILILSEDHFFTTGQTIKELVDNDFDLAYAPWDKETDANASILCLNPKLLSHLFPIPEHGMPVERHLEEHVVNKVPIDRRHKITTRKHTNYFDDGKYTNSSVEMEECLKKAKIL